MEQKIKQHLGDLMFTIAALQFQNETLQKRCDDLQKENAELQPKPFAPIRD